MKTLDGFWLGLQPYFNSISFIETSPFVYDLLLIFIYDPGLIHSCGNINEPYEQGNLVILV